MLSGFDGGHLRSSGSYDVGKDSDVLLPYGARESILGLRDQVGAKLLLVLNLTLGNGVGSNVSMKFTRGAAALYFCCFVLR